MAKKKRKPAKSKQEPEVELPIGQPWIDRLSGMRVMTLVSLALAVFVGWQLYPTEGAKAILWGFGFGAGIWLVFALSLAFNVWMRGKRF